MINETKFVKTIFDLIEQADHIEEAEPADPDRPGFYFEAGEFSGHIYMDYKTACKYWPEFEAERE